MNQPDKVTLKRCDESHQQLESSEHELSSDAEFIERLNVCAEIAGSMSALARLSGMSQSGMRRYFNGGEPTRPVLIAIARAVQVNFLWLSLGEGEMYMDPAQKKQSTMIKSTVIEEPWDDPWQDFALVPFFDVEASAGFGSNVESEYQISQIAFRNSWLHEKGVGSMHLVTIKAKGDSMMPTISDGDILLVNTHVDKIIDDAIYIVRADQHLIVKRVQQNLDGSLRIISDNKIYHDQLIPPDQAKEVKIAGRVIWYGHEI